MAALCVIALTMAGMMFVSGLSCNSPPITIKFETVLPGHWWKLQLNEEQLEVIENLWGSDITTKQLLDVLFSG